jgi:glutathione S-transferase
VTRLRQLSPQGILPILKENDRTLVGERDILLHLEKSYNLARLAAAKKKAYNTALVHCQRVLEPIIRQLTENLDISMPVGDVLQSLVQELTVLDLSIKGPYYFGHQLTWVSPHTNGSVLL